MGRLSSYRLPVILLLLVAVGAAVAGALTAAGEDEPARTPPEAGRAQGGEGVSFLAKLIPSAPERERRIAGEADVPRSVRDLARRLPLEREVAQLFLLGFTGTDLSSEIFRRLERQDLGGIVIAADNYTGPEILGQLGGEAIAVARRGRRVPPWVMASQEGGEFNSFADLPPALAAADVESDADAAEQAGQSAVALREANVTGVLGPVIDVGLGDGSALGARVYSDDPAEVADYAAATTKAYRRGRVFSAVKHFPGLGSGTVPTEEGPSTVGLSVDELTRRDLVPFRAAFRAGAPAVMLSNALYAPDDFTVPGSLSKKIATDLLRRRLRFRGVAITDDLTDPSITFSSSVADAAVRAIRAGADMLYISGTARDQRSAYVAVLRAVRRGKVSRARIDEAVLRILEAKRRYGLIR